MRPRGRKIAIISAVVFLLNLQMIVIEITLRNLMFLRERMIEEERVKTSYFLLAF